MGTEVPIHLETLCHRHVTKIRERCQRVAKFKIRWLKTLFRHLRAQFDTLTFRKADAGCKEK